MENETLIPADQICIHYHIEFSFINALEEYGLIETTRKEETVYLYNNQIKHLEKLIRLHHELDINLEGIDAIQHLLQKVDLLQEELTIVKNRLKLFEDEE